MKGTGYLLSPLALPNTPQGAADPLFFRAQYWLRASLVATRSLGALPAQPLPRQHGQGRSSPSAGLGVSREAELRAAPLLLLQAAEVPLDGSTTLCFSSLWFLASPCTGERDAVQPAGTETSDNPGSFAPLSFPSSGKIQPLPLSQAAPSCPCVIQMGGCLLAGKCLWQRRFPASPVGRVNVIYHTRFLRCSTCLAPPILTHCLYFRDDSIIGQFRDLRNLV